MKAYDTKFNFNDMWCHSSVAYDYDAPSSDVGCLAAEWRTGNETIEEAMENLYAHITES